MTLQEAIDRLGSPPVGATTLISAALAGDFSSIPKDAKPNDSDPATIREAAKTRLEERREAQRNCGSDWAYWGYEGEIGYLESVVALAEAAEKVGADNLPDIEGPKQGGVLMDCIAHQTRWANAVLNATDSPDTDEGDG